MTRANGKAPADPRNSFFPGKKRQVTLENWSPKRNTEGERRILFKFKMPITGQPLTGFPDFLNEGFHAVEKERSGGVFTSDSELEAMAIEYFDTADSPEKITRAVGVTLQGLTLQREKEGESYVTVLRYHYTVPWFKGLWRFVDTYWGKELFCDFTPSADYVPDQDGDRTKQMKLGDKNEDEEGDGMPHQTKERAAAVQEA
ncbi:MAG TPA: hypothetical protein VGQ12_07530 [Candidatus Angelobacter sp.]|jgi:hypothetical protein|nr:hypothetical protein [Candidatus Angelobacter sp.]